MKRYSSTNIRYDQILNAAVSLSRQPGGWSVLTRQRIAEAAGCCEALVSRYLGDMEEARCLVINEAIKHEILEILVQSLVAYDGFAIPRRLKRKALLSLLVN